MTELSFAKSFLSLLDSRPQKLPSDYIAPPKSLEINGPYTLPHMPTPMRKTSSTKGTSDETTSTASNSSSGPPSQVTVTLKSTRPPVISMTLPHVNVATTSILQLKEGVAKELRLGSGSASGLGMEKVKILHARKPVPDVKTIKEVLGGEEGLVEMVKTMQAEGKNGEVEVELGVMVMGWKGDESRSDSVSATVAPSSVPVGGAAGVEGDGEPMEGVEKTTGTERRDEKIILDEAFWKDLRGFLIQRVKDEGNADEVLGSFRGSWKGR